MFGLGPATKIYVAVGATDMRKGFDGLYGLARDKLGLEVRSGHLLLFVNSRRNRLKILTEMGVGFGFAPRETLHNARRGLLTDSLSVSSIFCIGLHSYRNLWRG